MNNRKKRDNKLYSVTRKQAYERDNGQCVICELRNLACLCMQCHNQAHGVFAKDIRKHLLEEVEKRTDEYERISND